MVRYRLLLASIAGGFFLGGLAFAEPATDRDLVETGATKSTGESAEVWGDPEDNLEADDNWTWFGMGYERRLRSRSADNPGDDIHGRGDHQREHTR